MNLRLDTPVQYVPRIGPMMAGKLSRMGIRSVGDLLFTVPFRYNDFSRIVPIQRIVVNTTVTVEGRVESIKNIFTKNGKKIQEAVIRDATGLLTVIWFNQVFLPKIIHPNDAISLSGAIGFFGNTVAMMSPEYEILSEDNKQCLHTGRIVPVYSETKGVSSKWLRGRIAYLLSQKHLLVHESIPPLLVSRYHLMGLLEAIEQVHFPSDAVRSAKARQRLAFDELLTMQLTSKIRKKQREEQQKAPDMSVSDAEMRTFTATLPFVLTEDQQSALRHLVRDMTAGHPMNRLLEGDVGSGKTVVAAAAMYIAHRNGYGSLLMAPTQILAQQHYCTIQQLLKPFGIPVQCIIGGKKNSTHKTGKKSTNNKAVQQSSNEKLSVYIGTHALLEQTVHVQNIGLVVVDEQQRFGVSQRSIVRSKGKGKWIPHFLTMTATPIPRTLALTLYGNLDMSVLTQMPKGRIPIKTWVVPNAKRPQAYDWIKKQIRETGARVFIVCPFIDESESIQSVRAAKKEFILLKDHAFPDVPIGLMHGRMKGQEKTAILDSFRSGSVKILVTTPVVEVGIDIPEATIMVIEGAERFGLSQLHQLRGRVGRGTNQSYCLLFSEQNEGGADKRLKILETVKNGPDLAEYDLLLRGEGDVFGLKQHGIPPLSIASLRDKELVAKTKEAADTILSLSTNLSEFPLLRERIEKGTIGEEVQD